MGRAGHRMASGNRDRVRRRRPGAGPRGASPPRRGMTRQAAPGGHRGALRAARRCEPTPGGSRGGDVWGAPAGQLLASERLSSPRPWSRRKRCLSPPLRARDRCEELTGQDPGPGRAKGSGASSGRASRAARSEEPPQPFRGARIRATGDDRGASLTDQDPGPGRARGSGAGSGRAPRAHQQRGAPAAVSWRPHPSDGKRPRGFAWRIRSATSLSTEPRNAAAAAGAPRWKPGSVRRSGEPPRAD